VLDQADELGKAALMFVAFCLGASGTYFWNDVLDVEADRAHPTKSSVRSRPAGELGLAGRWGSCCRSWRWASAADRPVAAVAALAAYMVITLSYSAVWKHVAVLDLVAIASGFVLRAAAGALAVDVPMSSWFVLVITFGSLFIVTGKRYAEPNELGDGAHGCGRRSVSTARGSCGSCWRELRRSARELLRVGVRDQGPGGSDLPWYELSIVPMLTALFRYALVLDQGHGAAPEEVFHNDRVLQLLGVAWVVVFGAGGVHV
jgi:decaprenyl-phosphate phosphoribosyltransferase